MLKILSYGSLIAICITLGSCRSEQDQDTLNKNTLVDTSLSKVTISDETINGIINSIPSPLETVTLIKESGLKYDESFLNPSDNIEKYKSKYAKSFAIGIYSADLGYLNLYEKNVASLNYIVAVRKLSQDLGLEQFFDFETLKRLASSNKNLDSLLYISTSCFNKMDSYLRKNKRSEQSSLIIIGAWIEGLYFETEMAKNNPSKKIRESIGSQKVAINSIMAILDVYKNNDYFKNVKTQMDPLKKLFDKVDITYNYKEPETKEVNGELVIIEKSESVVTIPDDVFKDIITNTGEIRKAILNSTN
ncbi:MAG: hypothetical protein A3F72_14445 [Bacteroidetes bacterium RIFCSPLOWO2_12_FULL_35_15]|nr:MAG: hypothetical protein A3F72_14445 [Bacteroidetes bacterium RIFCSPLOWO2_12_FULL_35_15]